MIAESKMILAFVEFSNSHQPITIAVYKNAEKYIALGVVTKIISFDIAQIGVRQIAGKNKGWVTLAETVTKLQNNQSVQAQLDQNFFEFFNIERPNMPTKEQLALQPIKKDNGKYTKSISNVEILINRFGPLPKKNLFNGNIYTVKTKQSWAQSDTLKVKENIEQNTRQSFNTNLIEEAIIRIADRNSYHPVKDFIESKTWDGIQRAERIFIDYLGAEDTEYTRSVAHIWLSGALTRIYNPGIKFDLVPILKGKQGIGKTTLVERLGGEWFSNSLKGLGNTKDDSIALQGSWIIELGEMSAMRKTEIEKTKNFISQTSDKFREPYAKQDTLHQRQTVFIGTTNSTDVLKDLTGNRRFAVIISQHDPAKLSTELTRQDVQQIWAEVKTWYENGTAKLVLSKEMQFEQMKANEELTEVDEAQELLATYLDMPLPANWLFYNTYQKKYIFERYQEYLSRPVKVEDENGFPVFYWRNPDNNSNSSNLEMEIVDTPHKVDVVSIRELLEIFELTNRYNSNDGKKIGMKLDALGWENKQRNPYRYTDRRRFYRNEKRLNHNKNYFITTQTSKKL